MNDAAEIFQPYHRKLLELSDHGLHHGIFKDDFSVMDNFHAFGVRMFFFVTTGRIVITANNKKSVSTKTVRADSNWKIFIALK